MPLVSVIIPTMQKNFAILETLIKILAKDGSVAEIIIINNTNKELLIENNKVKIINPGKNLYVNKAWNIGVELAKEEYFALVNDDLLVCENFVSKCMDLIKDKTDFGTLGMDTSSVENKKELTEPEPSEFYIEESPELRNLNWGVIIFGKKNTYKNIPCEMKIWCGDDFIRYTARKKGLKVYNLKGANISHIGGASGSNPNLIQILCRDIAEYCRYDRSFRKTSNYVSWRRRNKKEMKKARIYVYTIGYINRLIENIQDRFTNYKIIRSK